MYLTGFIDVEMAENNDRKGTRDVLSKQQAIRALINSVKVSGEALEEFIAMAINNDEIIESLNTVKTYVETAKSRADNSAEDSEMKTIMKRATGKGETFMDFYHECQSVSSNEDITEKVDGKLIQRLRLFTHAPDVIECEPEAIRKTLKELNDSVNSAAIVHKFAVAELGAYYLALRKEYLGRKQGPNMSFTSFISKSKLIPAGLSLATLQKYAVFTNFVAIYKRFLINPISYSRIMKWMAQLKDLLNKPTFKKDAEFWKNVEGITNTVDFGKKLITEEDTDGNILQYMEDPSHMDVAAAEDVKALYTETIETIRDEVMEYRKLQDDEMEGLNMVRNLGDQFNDDDDMDVDEGYQQNKPVRQ